MPPFRLKEQCNFIFYFCNNCGWQLIGFQEYIDA
jgi:hypothetical protein